MGDIRAKFNYAYPNSLQKLLIEEASLVFSMTMKLVTLFLFFIYWENL